jgi:exopolysaccharide biosynthesis WecB/TagA/CpsF family protein
MRRVGGENMYSVQSETYHDMSSAIQDIEVNVCNIDAALDVMISRAKSSRGYTLFTINLDHLVKLRTDRRFYAAYQRADFVTADGWPIVWALRHQNRAVERTTGADLVDPLCARAAREALPMFFIGPSHKSQRIALDILQRRHPGIVIAGANSPTVYANYIEEAAKVFAEDILKSGARICVISLGAPKQELLADALRRHCPEVGFLCVGAALDFISGEMARAPSYIQHMRLEWMWRLASDPKRLGARYLECMLLFAKLVWIATAKKRPHLGVRGPLPT